MDSSGCRVGLHGGMEAEEEDESRSEPSAISTEQEAASGTDSGQMSEGRTSAGSKVRTGAQRRRARAPSEAVSPVEAKLEAALERARTYAREGQAAEGVAELVRCVALSRVLFGDGHWRLAQAYTDLAHAYLHLRGLASQARQHAETARRILLCGTLFAPSVQEKLDILHTLFSMYCTLGKATAQLKHLKESEQNLMKAEKILEELQESKLDVSEVVQLEVELITTQGRLYVQQGKATQAVLLLERSLKLMQSLVSTDGAQIIEAHRWLVRAHQLCSNHEAAIEISLQAKAIAGSSFGPGSTKVAQVIHTLGQAYTCTGNTEHEGLAEQNLLESLSMYKQAGLAESSRALAVLDDLCHLHVHMKKYQEAFERLRSSMGMKREVFGECSEKVAETFHLMGAIRMAQGELPSAYRLMKKCLDIQSILYGPQHKKTKATKETLDTLSRCPGVVAKRNAPKADPSRRHLSAAVEKQKPPK